MSQMSVFCTSIIINMLKFLSQPYPADYTNRQRLVLALSFGVFTFLFLIIFQPFQLSALTKNKVAVIAGYGLVVFLTVTFNMFFFPLVFRSWFSEEKWVVWKEVVFNVVNIILVAIGVALFSGFVFEKPVNMSLVLQYIWISFAVGIFPVTFLVIFNQTRLLANYKSRAAAINESIRQEHVHLVKHESPKTVATIDSDIVKESFSVSPDELLYISSSDNYIKIYYSENEKVKNVLLRSSLKKAEACLQSFLCFYRCHRTYIINLNKVTGISGNAQGYKLSLKDVPEQIPVSRSLNKEIGEKLKGPIGKSPSASWRTGI
jgi:hypothetical protein